MKKVFLMMGILIASSTELLSQGQFKIRNDAYIQIGYTGYKALTFGQGTNVASNNGNFSIEYCNGCTVPGLNIWKPWPTSGSANFLMFIRDNGNVGVGNAGDNSAKMWISGNLKVNSTRNSKGISKFGFRR